MHSSRMRTGRSLTVYGECLLLVGGGGLLLGGGGVSALGGCLPWGGVCSWGDVCGGIPACTEADTPPANRMTNRCKNITLATTSLRLVRAYSDRVKAKATSLCRTVLIYTSTMQTE